MIDRTSRQGHKWRTRDRDGFSPPHFAVNDSLAWYFLLIAAAALRVNAQAPASAWVYPSATGNLLYQLDERGQRIPDFSQCGYRGGTEPLPNAAALIPQTRWVTVNPGTGDDRALIQAAIDSVEAMTPDENGWRGVVFLNAGEYQLSGGVTIQAGGVVLKGAGDSSTSGTRLRATGAMQYTLIDVDGPGSRSVVSGSTHSLTQKLVPAGARTFEVDSVAGLAAGQTVIVRRPSTVEWIEDIDMNQLDIPWAAGSKNLSFDRVITQVDGNRVTVDAPLPQTFELKYGGGEIWRYTWSNRMQQVGIEDIHGFSDYSGSTDEDHAWKFIQMNDLMHGWVRNITAQYFGYSAVSVGSGAKWVTVADCQCLDPVSLIEGGRRYSFNNEGAELCLFVNNYARKGRHDFVFGALVPGPNAFVHGSADTVYSDTGPHHRWSAGGLFDRIDLTGNEINVQNRGNYGTGHGWSGAFMAVWNCEADQFRVRNPPTARNWLVGSVGNVATASAAPVGADPGGTYDRSGSGGKPVYPRSLYYGQLQQRMKWPDSDFREVWLGDVDQHYSTNGTGNPVACDAAWLALVEGFSSLPADASFDYEAGNRYTAFTFDVTLSPGDIVVAASLTVSLRAIVSADTDSIWLEDHTAPVSLSSLGWTPVSTSGSSVRTMEIAPVLLADGKLNVALGDDVSVDFAVIHVQVQRNQPATAIVTLNPVADATVRGGTYADTNFGTATTLETKEDANDNVRREVFLRWDLGTVSGRLLHGKVRLAGTASSQAGNETLAALVSSDTWGESSITWNNKPSAGKHFAQWLPVTGQPVEFIVTPQVEDALTGDRKLSMRIFSSADHGDQGNVSYASGENASSSSRPQLVLTFENTPPVISDIADQSTERNTATAPLPFTVRDDFTAAGSLSVTASSSNPALVPAAGIALAGNAGSRTVTVTPAPGQNGTAIVTLTVSDGTLAASEAFTLTVTDPAAPVTVSLNVAASSDDAEESASGVVNLTSTDLELVNDSTDQIVGLRFSGLTIPRSAVITSAAIQFTADEAYSAATSLNIACHDVDNAPAFSAELRNLSARPQTMTSVLWQPSPWSNIGEAAPAQRTPNLAAVMQQIVSRPGWASGNAMAFLIGGTGRRTAEAFDKSGGHPAVLTVTYSSDPGPTFTRWISSYPSLTGGNALPGADPDRDSFGNLLEYSFGTSPVAPDATPWTVSSTGGLLHFTYTRRSLTPDLSCRVEWSDTLAAGSWSATGVTQQILADNGILQTVKASIATGPGKRFLRLKVTNTP